MRCRSSCEGATPITPMNGAPEMRAGQLRRLGEAVGHLPVHQEGRGEERQEAEARHDHGEAPVGRNDLLDPDRQKVTRLGALDMHRSGERMDAAHFDAGEIGGCRAGLDLAVEPVERLHLDRRA